MPPILSGKSFCKGTRRPEREDVDLTICDLAGFLDSIQVPEGISLYGVFDGHCGSECALFLRENLPAALHDQLQARRFACDEESLTAALAGAFDQLERNYFELVEHRESDSIAGSTALVALIFDDILVVATVGDGCVVLCQQVADSFRGKMLNTQHRDENTGTMEGEGFLSVTRAFGSYWRTNEQRQRVYLKAIPGQTPPDDSTRTITCQPDVTALRLTSSDLFLLIGSDGFFDVAMYSHVANVVADVRWQLNRSSWSDPDDVTRQLINKVKNRTTDDVTLLLVCMRQPASATKLRHSNSRLRLAPKQHQCGVLAVTDI